MTVQIALDEESNDLIMLDTGGFLRVKDGRYTIQLVRNKLRTMLGEWKLDPTIGWLSLADLKHNPDLFDLELRAKKIILGTKGVQAISSMDISMSQRILSISFKATTIYGGISLTVPWSI